LYVTKADEPVIDQYRCKLPNALAILNSLALVPAAPLLCGIQLAPDRKIYCTTISSKLSVISQPDMLGAASFFETDKVDLLGNFGSLNLPSFINDMSFDDRTNFDINILDTCAGVVQFTGHTDFPGPASWSWDFGDGNTSIQQNPQHVFANINQLYTVRVTIRPVALCGYITRTRFLFPAGLIANSDFHVINNCDSGYVRFENFSSVYPDNVNLQYVWDFGDGDTSHALNPLHTYLTPGNFPVKLKIITPAACRNDSMTVDIDYTTVNIQASPDVTVNEGESIQLHATGSTNNVTWQPALWLNSSSIADPVTTPLGDIRYIVTATNDAGCKDMDTVNVKVNPKSDIYIPSAFTPNNDGLNDIFKPYLSMQYKVLAFTIYNRWGQPIFSTTIRDKGWDGRINGLLQDAGLYVWMLRVSDKEKREVEKHGTLMLIR
jgi:gliding motility-associated-like protein